MKVYLVADTQGFQWLVERICSSKEKADKLVEELLEQYEFDAINYYCIHEIEVDKEIEECIGFIE